MHFFKRINRAYRNIKILSKLFDEVNDKNESCDLPINNIESRNNGQEKEVIEQPRHTEAVSITKDNYHNFHRRQTDWRKHYLTSNELYDIWRVEEYVCLGFRKAPERDQTTVGHFWAPEWKNITAIFIDNIKYKEGNEIKMNDFLVLSGDGIIIYKLDEPYSEYEYGKVSEQWKEWGRQKTHMFPWDDPDKDKIIKIQAIFQEHSDQPEGDLGNKYLTFITDYFQNVYTIDITTLETKLIGKVNIFPDE